MTGGSILPVRDSGVIHQQLPRESRAFWFCCLSLFRYYRCCLWLLEVVLFSVTDLVSLGCSGCSLCGGLVMRWTTRGDCLARERAVDVRSVEVWSMAMGAVVFLPA
ncbi:hypothetical protein NC653_026856 [Populus alba x Populus x berolinensis]|uniref:Uncharacterized protein n=1 Tax=Populus alba x Populus x berolinensis TaxID=444605 RepID=A0AAD6M4R5_9ROSI|nr:hypothetical protein NC653_026856 [Populus alba x Populus x berolinensis]